MLRKPHAGATAGPASVVLAARLAALTEQQQTLALSIEGLDWEAMAAAVVHGEGPKDALAAQSLALHAARTGRPLVANALAEFLPSTDNESSLAAEASLQVLAVAACRHLFGPVAAVLEALRLGAAVPGLDPSKWLAPEATDLPKLWRAVAAACMDFETHRRRGVLVAAMLLLDRAAARTRESPLAEWFGKLDHPSHAALRGALRWCRLPVVGVRSWEWLWRDDLGPSAVDRLNRAATVVEYNGIFERAALAIRPKRAKRLLEFELPRTSVAGKLASVEGFIPPKGLMRSLSAPARRGLPRIAALVRGSPKGRLAAIEPLLVDADPTVRHALVRSLPLRSLADLCLDADARVARSAFIAWSWSGHLSDSRQSSTSSDHLRLVKALTRSPHEAVRVLATRESNEALAPSANSVSARLRIRHRMRRGKEATASYLAAQILGSDGLVRHDTIMLIRRLDQVVRFEGELIEVAASGVEAEPDSPMSRAAASAVAALGDLKGEAPSRVLQECLSARDVRVRANAVEAMGRRQRRRPLAGVTLPRELMSDQHHRVRGNAMRASITQGEPTGELRTGEGLMGMLADERVMHRAAGAWAAGCALRTTGRERLGDAYPMLLARICEMAQFDDSPAVRKRALLAAAHAQTELRAIITGEGSADAIASRSREVSK